MSVVVESDYSREDYDGCLYGFDGNWDTGEGSLEPFCVACSYRRNRRKRFFVKRVVHHYRWLSHRLADGSSHLGLELDDGSLLVVLPVPRKLLRCAGSVGPILRAFEQFADSGLKGKRVSVTRQYYLTREDWEGSVSELLRYDFESVDLIDGELYFVGRALVSDSYLSLIDELAQRNEDILVEKVGMSFDDGSVEFGESLLLRERDQVRRVEARDGMRRSRERRSEAD